MGNLNVVAHNMSAMFTNRELGITSDKKSKSMEKLSSGYRINRAADDASGLSISEQMRKKIRGLNQGAANIQDGISLCQVADGALAETQDILQRMNELSIKAANGTMSDSDRQVVQNEIGELKEEVDRIANTTCFNDFIHPLCSKTASTQNISVGNKTYSLPPGVSIRTFSVANDNAGAIVVDGVSYSPGQVVTGSYVYYDSSLDPNSTWPRKYSWYIAEGGRFGDASFPTTTSIEDVDKKMVKSIYTSNLRFCSIYSWDVEDNGIIRFNASNGSSLYCGVSPDGNASGLGIAAPSSNEYQMYFEAISTNEDGQTKEVLSKIEIQASDESSDRIEISLVDATASGVGIDSANVTTAEGASTTIVLVSKALSKVSEYRSYFGAIQNRLEHAYNINLNSSENTQDAESRIRDTNMAKEMVTYSKENILQQTGQSMLSQSNQANQGVLNLLQ